MPSRMLRCAPETFAEGADDEAAGPDAGAAGADGDAGDGDAGAGDAGAAGEQAAGAQATAKPSTRLGRGPESEIGRRIRSSSPRRALEATTIRVDRRGPSSHREKCPELHDSR
jgi:hypothetical protein